MTKFPRPRPCKPLPRKGPVQIISGFARGLLFVTSSHRMATPRPSSRTAVAAALPEPFRQYATGEFFDEMIAADGAVRMHYRHFLKHFVAVSPEDFETKRRAVDLAFLRQGVTFNVYGDSQGAERIFPFDLVPRIIPAEEWEKLEAGLIQRITALNLFLHDIYHEQNIIKDGTIPAHYVMSAKHFRREFVNCNVPRDIYIHICGTDIIRDD